MKCPNCSKQMVRRLSKFGKGSYWWGCSGYPECKWTAAEHPDGTMMSTPAGPELKELRTQAHRWAEQLWGNWDSPKCKKNEMYDWLKANTKSGHIGMMDKEEVLSTIEKLKTFIQWKDVK